MRYGLVNTLFEKIYEFKCRGTFGFVFLSNILVKFADPVIKTTINSQSCYIRFSHQGVYYMRKFPNYDKNLGRICSYLKSKYNRRLFIVDIGANVGDTILCIGDRENYYLAIEGEKRYYSLLRSNLKEYKYKLIKTYCGEKEQNSLFNVDYDNGTGKIFYGNEGKECTIRTVDSLLSNITRKTDFIKIDTDGFDFAIIRGMKNTIKKDKPVMYFEWTAPELIQNNENLLDAFVNLGEMGYDRGLIFDKYGNFLCSLRINELHLLEQLIKYSIDADLYYDVCLFHKSNKLIDLEDLISCFWRK